MIGRRGGLFLASAAVCAVLLSTTTIEQVEARIVNTLDASLPKGQNAVRSADVTSYHSKLIDSRRLEEQQEQNGGEEQEEEKEQEQEQQYQEAQDEEEQEAEEEQEQQQEEEYQGNNEVEQYENDDGSGFYDNVQDAVYETQDKAQNLMDRFDEDISNMWSTSPAEWDDEYWKVFGVVGGAFTLLLSCILYLFCVCCRGDKDQIISPKSKTLKKRNHRGLLFDPTKTSDNDTVGSSNKGDVERPFVLLDDVEKDDAKSKLTDADGLLSPMTAGNTVMTKGFDQSLKEGHTASMSVDDGETLATYDTRKTFDTRVPKKESGGIINETVDVWKEFLGLKKSKYNKKMKPPKASADEDDDINLTDDERAIRRRGRSPTKAPAPTNLMKTGTYTQKSGTYTRPKVDSNLGIDSNSTDDAFEYSLTPHQALMAADRDQNPDSPRRTALIKTKNLLKSFGNSNHGSRSGRKRGDSKEESLLTGGDAV